MTEPNRQSGEKEERIIEIEIERLRPFKEHPFQVKDIPGMQDEMRRPMMLIVSANKKVDRLAEVDNKNYLQLRNNVLV